MKSSIKKEVCKFGIVGISAVTIQYTAYFCFLKFANLSILTAAVLSYILSFIFNYILTSFFTFRRNPTIRNGIGFIFCHLINMSLQSCLVIFFANIIDRSLALVPAMILCVPINFILVRKVMKS